MCRASHVETQDHNLAKALDNKLIELACRPSRTVRRSPSRSPCATSTAPWAPCCPGVSRPKYGHAGLPDDTVHIRLNGTAGQSFGAFLVKGGLTLELVGEGNDYVGKGPSGGRIIVRPAARFPWLIRRENIIIGNTVLTVPPKAFHFAGVAASVSPCATPAPPRWWKAWATTVANT